MRKGNFFKFVHQLQKEEFEKSVFFENLLATGGATGKLKKRKLKVILLYINLNNYI